MKWLDLHYRQLRLRRAIKGALERLTAWVLQEWACARCGHVTPWRWDLTLVEPDGTLCHACLAAVDVAPKPPRPPARVRGRVRR